jgi:arylsulfatase A
MIVRSLCLAASLLFSGCLKPAAAPPNIVLILTDDMGLYDTGVYGSPVYETPSIDRLAAQGMRFTSAYSAANVCSPTRAGLLTGKHPARLHITTWIPGHQFPWAKLREPAQQQFLPLGETTIAEALRPAGYRTASFGKWHLGGAEYFPEHQGFDEVYQKDGREPHHITDVRVTDLAIEFIEANRERPFFLYVPFYSVHEPVSGPEEYERDAERGIAEAGGTISNPGSREPLAAENYRTDYAAMVRNQDDCVGRIMEALDRLELAAHTVLVFVSDNGGLARATPNAPLRGGKGTMYEGGVRIPLIVRWPETVEPGSSSDAPVITTDLFPTLLEIAGMDALPTDGVGLLPLLRGEAEIRREALYWHFPHYHGLGAVPYSAVRQDDWKLIEFLEENRLELYNLSADPGETENIADVEPERAAAMRQLLDEWRGSVGAQMPAPNSEFDPARADYWKAGTQTRQRTPLP